MTSDIDVQELNQIILEIEKDTSIEIVDNSTVILETSEPDIIDIQDLSDHIIEVGGEAGPRGPQGLPGSGSASGYYHHEQGLPSDTWNIPHMLGYRPSITTFNSANEEFEGVINHIDLNNSQVLLKSATAGTADCS